MSKKILALALAVIMLLVTGCQSDDQGKNNNHDDNGNHSIDNNQSNNGNEQEENIDKSNGYVFKGIIKSLDNQKHIEMDIVDSDVAFGIYWVLVGNQTDFVDKNGITITRNDLKVGDTIEVTFSGQVMMSFPPQISAWTITKL